MSPNETQSLPHMARHGGVIGLAAFSGVGKTTLAEKLIAELTRRGVKLATIKRAHHQFDADTPGKDSWRHRKAGAHQVLVASAQRRVMFTETPEGNEPDLDTLLGELQPAALVLVEGFKHSPIPKIELHRSDLDHPLLYETDPNIVAIASDRVLASSPLPCLDLNDPAAIADFILSFCGHDR